MTERASAYTSAVLSTGRPSRTYATGRCCASCNRPLSRYNPQQHCAACYAAIPTRDRPTVHIPRGARE